MNDLQKGAAPVQLKDRCRFSIYYEDTDFSGNVYHANYLKFFERAREELISLEYVRELYKRGFHYVVAHIDIAFHRPARHGDQLEIETCMSMTRSPNVQCQQKAYIVSGQPSEPIVTATLRLVAVNAEGQPIRTPLDVLETFAARSSKSLKY